MEKSFSCPTKTTDLGQFSVLIYTKVKTYFQLLLNDLHPGFYQFHNDTNFITYYLFKTNEKKFGSQFNIELKEDKCNYIAAGGSVALMDT